MASPIFAADVAFDRFCDTFAAEWMRADPQRATTLQYFSGAEQDALDRQLTPITKDARAARVATARRGLVELRKYDCASLDATQRVSAATLEWQLNDVVRAEPFLDYAFVFQQYSGLQVQLVNFLSQTHPIRNRRDIENYLARLELVAGQMDEGIRQAKDRAARGILPPRFIKRMATNSRANASYFHSHKLPGDSFLEFTALRLRQVRLLVYSWRTMPAPRTSGWV